jgi:cytoskeleton protein RodZ
MSDKDVPVQMGLIDGPGTMLRRAREEKGLDIAAVAAMLHLSEFKIKAIEADDFESLPEPVFVRGYLKNYARILDEQVDPVLNAYTNFSSEPVIPEQKLVESDREIEVHNKPDLVKVVTIVVVVAIIAIPLFWWWSDLEQLAQDIVGREEVAQSELPVLPSEPESEKEIGLPGTIPLELSEIGDTDKPVVEEEAVEEERVKATIETKPEVSAIKELELPESQIKPLDIPQQPVVEEIKTEPKPKPKAKPVVKKPVSTLAPKQISIPVPKPASKPAPVEQGVWFKFVESGWVKVRDAKNRVILIGEHNKGAIKKLGSVMPYKVVLGNSKAVKVEINGKVVNVDRYSSGGVARFTIDNGKIGKP